jgi:hypothetical protein
LLWCINKSFTDLVRELQDGDKVAYTEAKAHGDPKYGVATAA